MTQPGNATPLPPGQPTVAGGGGQPPGELVRSLTHRQTTMIGLGCVVLLVWLLILASYLAFRRSAQPAARQDLRVWGGAWTAWTAWTAWAGIAGVLAVASTAAVVPVMAQAAGVGSGFTLALLLVYALKVRHVTRRDAPAAPNKEAGEPAPQETPHVS
ncbi:hypothetical protein [Streptomyces soliscabiei]|uniref:hypothetical protein n=1 Tax=Streptomyces soliscabiei TaxID=588897 RepID=UPI0029BD29F1|nr:hypothetical protein [Streptomyces sp. NY05-11A]MDX2682628.1 hypothetical protein [Streptomyces sp. NY05-11A]